jgi:PAT family beta-lactamase induction signal transducer AmpG
MLFFGIAAGLPLLLIFSSLSLWLREAGIERATVTYFSWAALGYSFKFVWSPLVDRLPLPGLTRWLGRRRAWLLLSQLSIMSAIAWMAMIDPANESLLVMAAAAILLGFSSATQDVAIDAYRIESAEKSLQAMMSATYIAGYRIGMLLAGAGALYLADFFGSSAAAYSYSAWHNTYLIMSAMMLIGVITTLSVKEPAVNQSFRSEGVSQHLSLLLFFIIAVAVFIASFYFSSDLAASVKQTLAGWLANSVLASFVVELLRFVVAVVAVTAVAVVLSQLRWVDAAVVQRSYLDPVKDFFSRYGVSVAWLLLTLVGFYRVSDIVLGVIANVFYQDLGFSKSEIATVVKSFGLLMTLIGGFLGGVLTMRYGVMRILFIGALLSALTNLLFMLLAGMGHDLLMLYVVISADNLSAGLASAAFIAFLSSLTNISFTAVQYAIFSSLMTLFPKLLGGYSGTMVDGIGYENFFLLTALLGLPVLLLVWLAGRSFDLN